MALLRLEAPAVQLVEMEDLKLRLKIDDDADDTGLAMLLSAATRRAEQKTQRAFLTQKWRLTLDGFPAKKCGEILLPLPPLQSVDQIVYVDSQGVEQVMDPQDYQVVPGDVLGAVYPAVGLAWPATDSGKQSVKIDFTCGYGDPSEVEPDIVLAVLFLVGHYEQNREAVTDRTMSVLPMGVDDLLSPYIVPVSP